MNLICFRKGQKGTKLESLEVKNKPHWITSFHMNVFVSYLSLFVFAPLQALKRTFKKLDHDVNIHEFLGARNQTIKGLSNHVAIFQAQLMVCHRRLSCWTNINRSENAEHFTFWKNH
ncbi:hypothetical protein HID58_065255 [Brassica napus]|uniref:Uncharacterized protein n=1 Tax=Brassica napus TaxID=3708 RepID=A0ABQ7ZCA0_BRANA|nr:hypothetical protein HID58_065255 [Brassica napus]